METKKDGASVAVRDRTEVEFVPLGASDKVRLTASMVAQFIAVPSKSGALPSERDCIRFIMLCRGKRANPFEGDCFLIGYDNWKESRLVGTSWSMVCGVELFLKRAEQSEDYDGLESGVIVKDGAGAVVERQGSIVFDGESLLGGWAKVYRKDRGRPEYKAVKFSTYNTGRSRWEKDPGGQIAKVAASQALRTAYPTALGGLYTQEEMQRVTEAGDDLLAAAPRTTVKMPVIEGAEVPALPPASGVAEAVAAVPVPAAADPGEPVPVDRLEAERLSKVAALEGFAKGRKVAFGKALQSLEVEDVNLWRDLPLERLDELHQLMLAAVGK